MKPHRSDALLSMIGNTPLIPLHFGLEGLTILAKAEFLNPGGSVKDRLARCIILDAAARIVTILCDRAGRYFSTAHFGD